MPSLRTLAEGFLNRFTGLPRAHGVYNVKARSASGKMEGSARTDHTGATVDDWLAHLEGRSGIGIVPIRDDGTVRWGALDIDDYHLDLKKLEVSIREAKLPLVLCRTKSGGAHLYLFLKDDASAETVRERLLEWGVALGYPNVEVFPKQTRLAGPRDVGNWINMPYFGKTRLALHLGKEIKDPAAFLALAGKMAVSAASLGTMTSALDPEVADLLQDGPPCLQYLAQQGFAKGTRNNGMFNLMVYLRKRYGDDWEEHISAMNEEFMDPGLKLVELTQLQGHVGKKEYEYRCHEPPIVSCCNRPVCLTRTYGIGTSQHGAGVHYGTLIKLLTEPALWIMQINAERVELTTKQLMDQRDFQARCIEVLSKWPKLIKSDAWKKMIMEKLATAEEQHVPPDATPGGLVKHMLGAYCTQRGLTTMKEELLLHRVWHRVEPDVDVIHFSGVDFHQFLDTKRIRFTQKDLWAILRRTGAKSEFFTIKGKGINTWYLAFEAISIQQQPFTALAIPDEEEEEM